MNGVGKMEEGEERKECGGGSVGRLERGEGGVEGKGEAKRR